ncbi:MAG TPA: hypothetical protein VER96_05935 [Polyangiaceae bacterium]|nr:hypothetical protein [Polyangiaceae bacterium]
MMRAVVKIAVLLGVASALCLALWPARRPTNTVRNSVLPSGAEASPEREQPAALPRATAVVPASLAVAPVQAVALPDEASLMSTLRALGDSDPERSLQLARAAEQRFPASPDAAERSWYVCKSLVNLARFSDAREEARRMAKEYPDTSWTADVTRHLLVNPPDLPENPAL